MSLVSEPPPPLALVRGHSEPFPSKHTLYLSPPNLQRSVSDPASLQHNRNANILIPLEFNLNNPIYSSSFQSSSDANVAQLSSPVRSSGSEFVLYSLPSLSRQVSSDLIQIERSKISHDDNNLTDVAFHSQVAFPSSLKEAILQHVR